MALLTAGCSREDRTEAPVQASRPPKIVQFYASQGGVGPGENALLCYGVEDAVKVSLTPAVEDIFPSPNRCIEVAPATTTTYTLVATGQDGREASASLTIRRVAGSGKAPKGERVGGAPAETPAQQGLAIASFTARPQQISNGAASTLCYEVANASAVRVEPKVVQLGAVQRGCFYVSPDRTTTYTLEAESDGKVTRRQVTVAVR
jgi:hypothetical protein